MHEVKEEEWLQDNVQWQHEKVITENFLQEHPYKKYFITSSLSQLTFLLICSLPLTTL